MNKINKKSIILALGILAIFTVGVISLPTMASASSYGYGYYLDQPIAIQENPAPSISSINPRSSNVGVGTKTITINGSGFTPNSIVRINGTSRYATFIDNSHLLIQITGNDTSNYRTNGGFYITVFNSAPGGGYSNAAFFTVNNPVASPAPNNNSQTTTNFSDTNNNYNNTNTTQPQPDNWSDNNPNSNYSNLASNAIFGSNSVLPSGLIQWILLAILIMIIVILIRKIFGGAANYHSAPLKHD
jgi:hypothetical protein